TATDGMMKRRSSVAAVSISTLTVGLGVLLGVGACDRQLNPFAVDPPKDCSIESQHLFVVDVMRDFYLWNGDLPTAVDIAGFETPEDLVRELRVGNDRWTRIADKVTSDALFMEGKFVGLGYKTQRGADNEVRISFVSDNS